MAYSLLATYCVCQEFKLPKILRDDSIKTLEDLDKHPLINEWWIKWNVLNILWKDGTKTQIDGTEVDNDFKRPDGIEVCEKDNSFLYDEDENSDDEEPLLDDRAIPDEDLPEEVRKARKAYYDILNSMN